MNTITAQLAAIHPFDSLTEAQLATIAKRMSVIEVDAGDIIFEMGDPLKGLYTVVDGEIELQDNERIPAGIVGRGQHLGERGLKADGRAKMRATARKPAKLLLLKIGDFREQVEAIAELGRFFGQKPLEPEVRQDLTALPVGELMTKAPLTCAPTDSIAAAARKMRDRHVSSILIVEDEKLVGLVTTRDLANRVLAEGLSGETPIQAVMTADPVALKPNALGADVLYEMLESGIGHLPVVDGDRLVGILSRTDLIRFQALSSGQMVREIVDSNTVEEIAEVVARIPELLAQLVGAGQRHEAVTRLVTDIGDAATRRLLRLAEDELGPPPVPYLWLACGSQGRQEQTGVSDQDNCLILDDSATPEHDAYFEELAKRVSDGLDACGYYYCPGEMMATTSRWRQPQRVWRDYFSGWVRKPDPMAQMLASVMFDLRPIHGEMSLFGNLQSETLAMASANSIFVAHMVANSLKHAPPLGLFRGFATVRSGEHKNTVDLKLNGVVPVVDLGRIYAIQGRLGQVNTRARLKAAAGASVISKSGARDLLAAYDMIAKTRLRHQARQVREGQKPGNFMAPATLSEFERHHLRDAFLVIKTMQSALAQGRATMA